MKQNQLTMTILSIVAIFIMIIPAFAVTQLEANTETNILLLEGSYIDGTDIMTSEPIDRDNADDIFDINIELSPWDANNDTLLMNELAGINDEGYYGNYITYTGNGSYTMTPDYTDNPEHTGAPATVSRYLAIPLNITFGELLNVDFLRINCDYDGGIYLRGAGTNYQYVWQSLNLPNNESIFILDLTRISWINENPDNPVWLQIGSKDSDQIGIDEPATINFKIETFELTAADSLSMQDETLYFLVIFGMNIMFSIAFVFALEPFDILIDRKGNKNGGKYNGKK